MTRKALLLSIGLAAGCGGSQEPGDTAPATGESSASVPAIATGGETPAVAGTPASADEPPAHPAPDFTLPDLDGNQVSLSSFRGKVVVLEWFNPGCPFVRYSHGEGPLRDLAAQHIAKGVVWLSINSGAPGKQGYGVEINRTWHDTWKMENPILLDEKGEVGKAYGARSTPTIVVIDAHGSIAYQGALDNAPLGKVPAEGHVVYVNDALEAVVAGRPPAVAETKSYGCSVKYSSDAP